MASCEELNSRLQKRQRKAEVKEPHNEGTGKSRAGGPLQDGVRVRGGSQKSWKKRDLQVSHTDHVGPDPHKSSVEGHF